MSGLLDQLGQLWQRLSLIGVQDVDYSTAHRITLSNQIAVVGTVVPNLYNLFYLLYDARVLLPVILINLVGSGVCASVLYLNHRRLYEPATLVIFIGPNLQIFLLTWFLGTASGSHLLHIMMANCVLWLARREQKWSIVLYAAVPLLLFLYSHFAFIPETAQIVIAPEALQGLYVSVVVSVFALIMIFVSLYYREVMFTEKLLEREHLLSEQLLHNILPKDVAAQLKIEPRTIAELHPSVTVLFADIVGFTRIASTALPEEIVAMLNEIFSRFDRLVERHGLEKIKTIGDAYMVAGGIPAPVDDHPGRIAELALDMLAEMEQFQSVGGKLDVRIGFHTGPVIAGVIGRKKFSYDVWGDTVNTASRMESHGVPGRIHVSTQAYEILRDRYLFEERGVVEIKGIGQMRTYFLSGRRA
jgi:class 3 adenylate cyclase